MNINILKPFKTKTCKDLMQQRTATPLSYHHSHGTLLERENLVPHSDLLQKEEASTWQSFVFSAIESLLE